MEESWTKVFHWALTERDIRIVSLKRIKTNQKRFFLPFIILTKVLTKVPPLQCIDSIITPFLRLLTAYYAVKAPQNWCSIVVASPFFIPHLRKKKNPIRTGRNHATSRRSTSQHPLNPKSNCQLKKKHRLLFSTRASRRPHTHTHAHTLLAHTLTRVCEFNALNLFHLKIYFAFVLLSPSHLTPNSSSFLLFRCFFFLPSSRKVINTRGRPLNPSLSLSHQHPKTSTNLPRPSSSSLKGWWECIGFVVGSCVCDDEEAEEPIQVARKQVFFCKCVGSVGASAFLSLS